MEASRQVGRYVRRESISVGLSTYHIYISDELRATTHHAYVCVRTRFYIYWMR